MSKLSKMSVSNCKKNLSDLKVTKSERKYMDNVVTKFLNHIKNLNEIYVDYGYNDIIQDPHNWENKTFKIKELKSNEEYFQFEIGSITRKFLEDNDIYEKIDDMSDDCLQYLHYKMYYMFCLS